MNELVAKNGHSAPTGAAAHILLYGWPGGGKSTLLAALARAMEVQERSLGGRILDVSQGLRRLREEVYGQAAAAGTDGARQFPIEFQPFVDGKASESDQFHAVLLECDCTDLARPESKSDPIFRADAVLFVVDAAAADDQLETHWQQFRQFLQRFRKERGRRTDEPSLPFWLVLAKCDRLAKPGDNLAVWSERMEMRKEEVAQRFGEVLHQDPASGFGTVRFAAAATGIKQPMLTNATGQSEEPFGVAELFRDALIAARAHRDKKVKGELNLRRLVAATGLVAAAIAGFAIVSPLVRSYWKPSPALTALTAFRSGEGTPPAGHLTEPIEQRIDQLRSILAEPGFDRLSHDDQAFATQRLEELERYRDFAAAMRRLNPLPELRSLDDLKRLGQQLQMEAAPPKQFAESWKSSDAMRTYDRVHKQLEDRLASARQTLAELDAKRTEFDRLFVLQEGKPNWSEWSLRVHAALDSPLPFVDATIVSIDEVATGQQRYAVARQRLTTMRDILHALGVATGPGQTLLVNREFKPEQAPGLLAALIKEYPRATAWGNPDVSDVALEDVRTAARTAYRQLLPSGRALVETAMGSRTDGPESTARWRTALETATGSPQMAAWSELARIAMRLAGDNADPVAELAQFLKRDQFVLDISALELVQPDGANAIRYQPTGSLTLFVQNAQGQVAKKPYRAAEPISNQRIRFAAVDAKPLVYRPGDLMWVELGVTDPSKADLQLTWWANGARSKLYQFDRLNRAPRIHRIEQRAEDGKSCPGIRLEFAPPGALPAIPDLMPEDLRQR